MEKQPTTLNFVLSTEPNKNWGSKLSDRPPSYSNLIKSPDNTKVGSKK